MNNNQKEILLVDDDENIRKILAEFLSREGFKVIEAKNGQEALQLIESGDQIGVMVSDISMPVMDGVTLVRQTRKLRDKDSLKIILTSGYHWQEANPLLDEDLIQVCLKKPYQLNKLLQEIIASPSEIVN